jgi:hypothetical protein
MVLAIYAESFSLEHRFQVPEEWFRTELTRIGLDPIRSCFPHAVNLSESQG